MNNLKKEAKKNFRRVGVEPGRRTTVVQYCNFITSYAGSVYQWC